MADANSETVERTRRLMVATIGIAFTYIKDAPLNDVMMGSCIDLLRSSADGLEELVRSRDEKNRKD